MKAKVDLKKINLKNLLSNAAVFFITAALCVVLLTAVACIPKTSIEKQMQSSATYMRDTELFGYMVEGVNATKLDHYADSILLNIGWCFDSEHPLESVMLSPYYSTKYHNENDNLYASVFENQKPTTQYLRYWHGSLSIVRPLLVFLNIEQIYVFFAVVLGVLALWLIVELLRRGEKGVAVSIIICMIATGIWVVPASLEYTWMFLLTFIASIIALYLSDRKDRVSYGTFFLIVGIIANYLDFLTTETLPCLVPLLLISWREHGREKTLTSKRTKQVTISSLVHFGIGYAGMWVFKWIMASAVLKINAMNYVTGHIEERIGGNQIGVEGLDTVQVLFFTILRNIIALFPAGYSTPFIVLEIAIFVVGAYFCYVYAKDKFNKSMVIAFVCLALIPYVRYLILHNHSFIHYFFTFRAQFSSILALCMIVLEVLDVKLLFKRRR